jgi:2-dehydropantoate 2-reductase
MTRIGIFGAGSIGCYLGGRLAAAGADVVLVGRLGLADGFSVVDLAGRTLRVRPRYETEVAALADRDVVLVTVKSPATETAGRQLAGVLRDDAIVVSFQNGVSNPEVLRAGLGGRRVAAGMVPFNVVHTPGSFKQTTSGPLGLETAAGPGLIAALRATGLELDVVDDLRPIGWSKLLLNLNNSVNALAGLPIREELGQWRYRRVFALAVGEGLRVLRAAGVRPARVGRMIPMIVPAVLSLPDLLFLRVAATMVKIDPAARSSMLDDLERGRRTEIEFLNGELIRLGERFAVATPVNRKIRELVRAAEASGKGSPKLGAAELLAAVRGR